MSEHSATRWVDWFSLPRYKTFRLLFRVVLVGAMFVVPTIIVGLSAGDLFARQRTESVRAIAGELPFTPTEQRMAEGLARDTLMYSGNFPIWDAPTSGFFGLAMSDAARPALDAAIAAVRQIKAAIDAGEDPHSDTLAAEITAAHQLFSAVGLDQGRDRAAVLYHRALLNIWTGDYGPARTDLDRLFARIEADLNLVNRSSATMARVRGVRIASHYARGYAIVRGNEQDAQARNAAIAEFRAALEIASGMFANRNTETSPLIELNAERHVVQMSTSVIWNDLLKVLSYGDGGIRQATREAELLIQSPNFLRSDPALAANLMMLVAADPSDRPVERRAALVQAMGRAVDSASGSRAEEARLRADAARAIVDAPVPERNDTVPDITTAYRTAFLRIHRGSAQGETSAYFPTVDIPGNTTFTSQLDAWLFIRQWRHLLKAGDLGGFESSYSRLRADENVDKDFFESWRADAMGEVSKRLTEASQNAALGRDERRAVFSTLVRSDVFASPLGRVKAALEYAYGGWWGAAVLLWLVLWAALLFLFDLLTSYRRTFEPHHHVERRRKRAAIRAAQ